MYESEKTRVDNALNWVANHRYLSAAVLAGVVIIGLGSFSNALMDIRKLVFGESQSAATAEEALTEAQQKDYLALLVKEQVEFQLSQPNGIAQLQSLSDAEYYQELIRRTGMSRAQLDSLLAGNRKNKEVETKAQVAQIERRFGDINEYRLGISVQKHEYGFQISHVQPNGPATKLTNSFGHTAELETGDIISQINGVSPSSVDEFGFLISQSPEELKLTIIDVRTGLVLKLEAIAKLNF